jgi:hypothetical protein
MDYPLLWIRFGHDRLAQPSLHCSYKADLLNNRVVITAMSTLQPYVNMLPMYNGTLDLYCLPRWELQGNLRKKKAIRLMCRLSWQLRDRCDSISESI